MWSHFISLDTSGLLAKNDTLQFGHSLLDQASWLLYLKKNDQAGCDSAKICKLEAIAAESTVCQENKFAAVVLVGATENKEKVYFFSSLAIFPHILWWEEINRVPAPTEVI